MPLRMLLDNGSIEPGRVALVGARNLDPGELEFIDRAGIHTGPDAVEGALEGADAVYVALDCDSVEPGELEVFMPEPDGLSLAELETLLGRIAAARQVAGAGLTGLVRAPANEPALARLCAALGL
jgi:arginase family enzyme